MTTAGTTSAIINTNKALIRLLNISSQQQFTITFDALLVGHEAGVTSLSWRPSSPEYPEPTLLSTSTDSSLILWSPSTILTSSQDTSTTLWINRHRFGDVGGQRLGGFVLGLWSRDGKEALGCGWSGGWRRWACLPVNVDSEGPRIEQWQELGAISGHGGAVRGLSWSPNGEYLISTGYEDMTFTLNYNLTKSHYAALIKLHEYMDKSSQKTRSRGMR